MNSNVLMVSTSGNSTIVDPRGYDLPQAYVMLRLYKRMHNLSISLYITRRIQGEYLGHVNQ